TRLRERAVAWAAPRRRLAEPLDDPAVQAAGIIQDVESPYGGKYRVITEPLKMQATPLVSERPAAAHGEHTREILAELGLSTEETAALLHSKAALTGDDWAPASAEMVEGGSR